MAESSESFIESRNTLEFTTVAAEYCSFLRKSETNDKQKFLKVVQKILPLLYLKASMIPLIDPAGDSEIQKFVTEADYGFILDKVSRVLGEQDVYLDVDEPISRRSFDATRTTLAECLTDIYQELSDFIQLFRIGGKDSMVDALWECQQSFEQYWGPRAVAALNAIHGILYGKEAMAGNLPQE